MKTRSIGSVTEAELQQTVERFTSEFVELIAQRAAELIRMDGIALRQPALRLALGYESSALDIASGPLPEVNLLDMLVFLDLCRVALEKHWIPNLLGEHGSPLLAAFTQSEERLWRIAAKVLDPMQQQRLHELIVAWHERHPHQVIVEWVRFQEFSTRAGVVAEDRAENARGLLGNVVSATQTADRAILLGERAMFMLNRIPFLVRAQVRLGLQEMLDDSGASFGAIAKRLDGWIRRWLLYLVVLGAAWSCSAWTGYYVVKRATAKPAISSAD